MYDLHDFGTRDLLKIRDALYILDGYGLAEDLIMAEIERELEVREQREHITL